MFGIIRSRREPAQIVLILLTVFAAYGNALFNKFAYDDIPIIQYNPLIRDWRNIPEVLGTGYWNSIGEAGGLYRPFSILTFMAEYSLAGLAPFVYHLDNVLLHFLCCVLVYFLAEKITNDRTSSFAAALLFAVHPVHVEVVSNVVGRSELLATFFTLAGILAFISPQKRLPWYVASPVLFTAGLLSKETAVVLPALILVYIVLFERDGRGKNLRSMAVCMLPYALVLSAYMLARYSILEGGAGPQGIGQVFLNTKGYWQALLMLRVFIEYVRLAVFPDGLHVHYMLRPPESVFSFYVLVFLMIAGVAAAASPWLVRHKRRQFFFMAWFVIALIPVSNIIPIGFLMAERSLFLPSASVCVLAGLLYGTGAGFGTSAGDARRKLAAGAALAAVLVTLGVMTHERNKVWYDNNSVSLDLIDSYNRIIREFPESGLYYTHLARTYADIGKDKESIAALKMAVEVEPGASFTHIALASRYRDIQMYYAALDEVQKAVAIDPELSVLSSALAAELYHRAGMMTEAQHYIEKALAEDVGDSHNMYQVIAVHLYGMGMLEEAERYIKRAMELSPYVPFYIMNYGHILEAGGRDDEALEAFDRALSLNPKLAEAHSEEGLIHARRASYSMAVADFNNAALDDPNNAYYRYYLGAAYHMDGNDEEAAIQLTKALALKPDYEDARTLLMEIRKPASILMLPGATVTGRPC